MDKKEIAKALEEVRSNPEVLKDLREQRSFESLEEVASIWSKALSGMDHDISPEDIATYIRETEEEMRAKTKDTNDKIVDLPDEELSSVAGGKHHDNCQVSYKDRENCWFADACDNFAVYYPGYLCHKFFKDTCENFMG